MPPHLFFILLICLLLALFCLTAMTQALRQLQKKESKKLFKLDAEFFFYRYLHKFCLRTEETDDLFFAGVLAQNFVRFCYASASVLFLLQLVLNSNIYTEASQPVSWPAGAGFLTAFFFLGFIIGDYLPRIFARHYPERALKIASPIASIFMTILFPFTLLFYKLPFFFSKTIYLDPLLKPKTEAKQALIEIIEESDFSSHLDPHDLKLIEAVVAFKDRITREIMVPRVDIFSLPHDTTIEKAAVLLLSEGYTRTPVYKNTLDHIIGVLMYKDLLAKYIEYAQKGDAAILQAPISTLVKGVIYTPETKKISHLLQEFRKKQVHLAIIVDEYGGTEGLATIENILEAIVGDIADEYDEEEDLFVPLPNGGWMVDARMPILDIEEQLGVEIPQDGDYDTIGGYIFHEIGTIPEKGFVIQKPDFELEVLRSDDRRVEKVRITPLSETQSDSPST